MRMMIRIMTIEEKFNFLKNKWEKETAPISSVSEIINNKNYLEILKMGEIIIPLVIKDLEETNNHWFYLLFSLTGENPVPKKNAGDMVKMTNDWVKWFEKKLKNTEIIVNNILNEENINKYQTLDNLTIPYYLLNYILKDKGILYHSSYFGLDLDKKQIKIFNKINNSIIYFIYINDTKKQKYFNYDKIIIYNEENIYILSDREKMMYNLFREK